MATTLSPPAVSPPTEAALPPDPGPEPPPALGLSSATALVIGSIIGTGVFTMPAVLAGAGTSSILTLVVISCGAVLLGDHVRPAHQAGTDDGRWPLRLRPPRVRRLRRLPHGLVLLDHLLGRQRRHRRLLGPLRRGALRHRQPVGLGQPRHRPDRPLDPRRHQPRRRPPDGVVPERHGRAQVPAAAPRGHPRLVLRQQRQLRAVQRLRRQPLRRRQPGRRRGPVLLHRRRVRLDRRRPGGAIPAATSVGHRSTGPPPVRCCTWP